MKRISFKPSRFSGSLLIFGSLISEIAGQTAAADKEQAFIDGSGDRYWYTFAVAFVIAIVGAIVLWRRSKKASSQSHYEFANRYQSRDDFSAYDDEGVDADKELEWFRQAKKSKTKVEVRTGSERRRARRRLSDLSAGPDEWDDQHMDSKAFQEKMKKLHFAQLPINSFVQLTDARGFEQLPLSADPALLSAIEQAGEEFEEDETVRELAVKILAAFRFRNSVEALSQIALYDLSSNLRSKAVAILMEFDHESVFETILLACADPTREVRASAARGLFRLSFDRAEAWKRLIATKDEFRMRHAARAAIESGIVQKSFDRLIHDDMRVAYEAFALVGLLIKSGETDAIFKAIMKHPDDRIKLALVHVLKVVKEPRSLSRLEDLSNGKTLADELAKKAAESVKEIMPLAAH